jgi:uncharacterized protein YndB with AHSA1/START domain
MMAKTKYVYVTYIASTPQKVFQAITDPALTRQYWGDMENISDWKPGSPWRHVGPDGRTVRMVGEVIEHAPPRRLVITWAWPQEASDRAKRTRVAFDLEQKDAMVKLTVTHDELEPGSEMERGITEGWPRVLSSLKSFLETGKGLDIWAWKK